jgi:hypothetical protein
MSDSWYTELPKSERISQGDIFYPGIFIYRVMPSSVTVIDNAPEVEIFEAPIIILTQACDLENEPIAESIVVGVLRTINDLSWDKVSNIMAGRSPSTHLLNEYHSDNSSFPFHVINFSDLHTVAYSFLDEMRKHIRTRLRLQSPYLEHAAQRFGSYFSRIGLPRDIDKKRVKDFLIHQ